MTSNATPSTSSSAAAAAPLQQQQLRRRSAMPKRTTLADSLGSSSATKNVIVLGGSYGGMHAASVLANRLPPSHRVILVERNSHFNHLYVFPRFSTLPGHEHKAFVPFSAIFKDAPKRPARAEAKPYAGPSSTRHTAAHADSKATASAPSQQTSEEMLGMGAVSGKTLQDGSTDSDASSSDERIARSRYGSSNSRSSSADGSSLFEGEDRRHRMLNSREPNASSWSSAASSYRSDSSDKTRTSDDELRAGHLAEQAGVEEALPVDGEAFRAEEALGRPEVQVEELTDAIAKGVRLDDGEEAVAEREGIDVDDVDVAEGFENSAPHVVLQANVSSITPTHVVVEAVDSGASDLGKLWSIDSVSIPYTHLIYALGSHLPDPLRTEARTKTEGIQWMQAMQDRVKASHDIVLVGGGALGVEFATDIKSVYGDKHVTLIHSRKQLLPNFDPQVHDIAIRRLNELGVDTVLGERLALTEGCPRGSSTKVQPAADGGPAGGERCPTGAEDGLATEGEQARNEGMCLGNGRKRVKTTGGREFECDLLLLCTGQQPNSSLMAQLSPTSVDPSTRLVRVQRTLQVKVPDPQGSLAQMPFDARPPCGDCDCFLDKKAAGGAAGGDDDTSISSTASTAQPMCDSCLSNVYAIGDVADAFGALNAGYQAWAMADVAAENIVLDIANEEQHAHPPPPIGEADDAASTPPPTPLKHFDPAVNMLKLSLGLGSMVMQGAPDEKTGRPTVEARADPEDLTVEGVWTFMAGVSTEDMYK